MKSHLLLTFAFLGGASLGRFALAAPSAGASAPDAAQPPIPIRFTLAQPGFVTLVIEDAGGKRVRNLVSETPFPAGANTAYWDGLDDVGRDADAASHAVYHVPGQLVSPGTYRVRGLVRPKIGLSYEMTPYFGAAHLPWTTKDRSSEWLTNHTPPSSVLAVPAGVAPKREGQPTSAGAQILVGSHVAEGGSGLAWLDANGRKVHGQGWIGGVWTGAHFMTRDTGTNPVAGTYAYTASAWDDELRLHTLLNQPSQTSGAGEDRPVLSLPWKFSGASGAAWNQPGATVGVSGLAAHNGLVAVSLPKLNQVLFVDGHTRRELGTMPVTDPRGLSTLR